MRSEDGIKRTATHNQRKNLFTLCLFLGAILYVPYFAMIYSTSSHNAIILKKENEKWNGSVNIVHLYHLTK